MIAQQLGALFNIELDELIDSALQQLAAEPALATFLQQHSGSSSQWQQQKQHWRQQWRYQLSSMPLAPALQAEVDLFIDYYPQAKPPALQPLSTALLACLQQLTSPFYHRAKALLAHTSSQQSWQYLFYQRWYQSLQSQLLLVIQQWLAEQQQQQLSQLKQTIEQFEQVAQLFSAQSYGGRLWDLSRAQLQAGDYQQLWQYHQFLSHQPALVDLAKQLGRQHQQTTSTPSQQTVQQASSALRGLPIDDLVDNLSALQLSNDLLRLVPTQLAALAIEELEYEFYRQLLEKQLLSYQLTSNQRPLSRKTYAKPATAIDSTPSTQGPFIVCVDSSGSMGGFNERCAKAFCLALLELALVDNRSCHVMLFTSEVIHYQFNQHDGLAQAARFLAQRFSGGTNLAACLNETLNLLQQNQWQQADVVVISDFIAERLTTHQITKIQQVKQNQQHLFHAITVSSHGKPQIMAIFDYIWQMRHYLSHRLVSQWLTNKF